MVDCQLLRSDWYMDSDTLVTMCLCVDEEEVSFGESWKCLGAVFFADAVGMNISFTPSVPV